MSKPTPPNQPPKRPEPQLPRRKPEPHPVDPRPPWHRPGRRTDVLADGTVRRIGWSAAEIAAVAPAPSPALADKLRRLFAAVPADEARADTDTYLSAQIVALQ